jgi:hypothetical protein
MDLTEVIAKSVYGVLGSRFPTASLLAITIIGAGLGGWAFFAVWSHLGESWAKDHPVQAASQNHPMPQASSNPEAPKATLQPAPPKAATEKPETPTHRKRELGTIAKKKELPTINVTSINQQGGITAGQVNIQQGQPPLPARRILVERKPEMIRFLSEKRGRASVSAVINDPEAFDFAQDWYDVLKAAGWEMSDQAVRSILVAGRPWTGVQIQIHGVPVSPGGDGTDAT